MLHTKYIDNRVKLITIGNKLAGKTTILRSLLASLKPLGRMQRVFARLNPSRYYVNIPRSWKGRTIQVEIGEHSMDGFAWLFRDFPGHIEYYATNSLFLFSASCVVILTIDLSQLKFRLQRLKQWLSVLNTYGESKTRRNVLIVGTHADDPQVCDSDMDWFKLSNLQIVFANMFPNVNICASYAINAKDRTARWVKDVRKHLQHIGKQVVANRKKSIEEHKVDMKNLILVRVLTRYWSTASKMALWKDFVTKIGTVVHTYRDDADTDLRKGAAIAMILHDMGDVLRVGSGPDSVVVLDLQWLSAIIGVIVRRLELGGIQHVENGIAPYKSVVSALITSTIATGVKGVESKRAPLALIGDVGMILQALESLHTLYCLGSDPWNSERKPTHILIPSRLVLEDVPSSFRDKSHMKYVGVRYQWKSSTFIPPGLLSCLMCRVNILNKSRSKMPSAQRSFVLYLAKMSLLVCLNRSNTCLDVVVASGTLLKARNGMLRVRRLIVKELVYGRWGRMEWSVHALCCGCCSGWRKRSSWKSCTTWSEEELKTLIEETKEPSYCNVVGKHIPLVDHLTEVTLLYCWCVWFIMYATYCLCTI